MNLTRSDQGLRVTPINLSLNLNISHPAPWLCHYFLPSLGSPLGVSLPLQHGQLGAVWVPTCAEALFL